MGLMNLRNAFSYIQENTLTEVYEINEKCRLEINLENKPFGPNNGEYYITHPKIAL